MRVKSAVNLWIKIIFYFISAILIGSLFIIPKKDLALAIIIILPMCSFLIWIYYGTYYELRKDHLYCKSGPFFEKIQYDKIKSAKLCENMLSSMALSSERIEIRQHGKSYITGTTMISPAGREEFLSRLLEKCRYLDEN